MTREEILDAAKKCVCGDRDEQYGTPENSFETISNLWSTYLDNRIITCAGNNFIYLDASDVAAMMALFKVGRIATGQKKADNWIDLAGYAACGGECEGENGA